MNEPEVLLKTHKFIKTQSFEQQKVVRLYTDAHHSLLSYKSLAPFQRFVLDLGDFVMHPDLVAQLSDGETIFAVEAKGDTDLVKGLAQADMYQLGFHYSFFAADAVALGTSLIDIAKTKNIGVFAVGDDVQIAYFPNAHTPQRDAFQYIARQMEGVTQVSRGQTFEFNLPTHYLVWAVALEPKIRYPLNVLPASLTRYPMPKTWRGALRGAQKLKLIRIDGDYFQLTPVGEAVKKIFQSDIAEWAQTHKKVGRRGSSTTLAQYRPQFAAVLQLLLLQDSVAKLIIEGLQTFPDSKANFAELATACDQLDHARAPILFLKPEAAVSLANDKGKIDWKLAQGNHYRSRTFYQYKSILKHAGILEPTTLGGATSKGYSPLQDIWGLV